MTLNVSAVAASSFEHFVSEFHAHQANKPNLCVEKGIDAGQAQLPNPTLEWAEQQARHASELAQTARRLLDRDSAHTELSFDQRLDLELAALLLDSEIHRSGLHFNDRLQLAQMPRAGDDIGDGIFGLCTVDPSPPEQRLEWITHRLEQVPGYLDALLERLDGPVARWVQMDIEKVQGLPSLYQSAVLLARDCAYSELDQLRAAIATATQAQERYVYRLKQLSTTTSFHVGPSATRKLIDLQGIGLSFEELHQLSCRFLKETGDTIEELRSRLVRKYDLARDTSSAALQQHLAHVHRVRIRSGDYEAILERYRDEQRRIEGFIARRDLFPIPEGQELRILRTPSFMTPSIPAGAMLPPAPFRAGPAESLVYLTLSEELLDEHTELSIPGMMIHEGIPGHHLQLATAARHPSVVRRHVVANEHHEGWTTMLEDYMLDEGYMGDLHAEARFCGKRDLSRIGARVAIDLFFMTGQWEFLDVGVEFERSEDPFVSAGNLLRAVTGFVPGRVAAEVNWYSQERGYPLCYLTGNHLVWQLKKDVLAKSDCSSTEADRKFHRTFLDAGNMPISFLRRVFERAGEL